MSQARVSGPLWPAGSRREGPPKVVGAQKARRSQSRGLCWDRRSGNCRGRDHRGQAGRWPRLRKPGAPGGLIPAGAQWRSPCRVAQRLRRLRALSVVFILGVWPEGSDGTDINAVCRAHERKLLSTGDDFGKVHLFSYPCSQFRVWASSQRLPSGRMRCGLCPPGACLLASAFTAHASWPLPSYGTCFLASALMAHASWPLPSGCTPRGCCPRGACVVASPGCLVIDEKGPLREPAGHVGGHDPVVPLPWSSSGLPTALQGAPPPPEPLELARPPLWLPSWASHLFPRPAPPALLG